MVPASTFQSDCSRVLTVLTIFFFPQQASADDAALHIAHCTLRSKKWFSHFGPLGPEKRPKRPVSGHRREKPNRRLRRHRNLLRFTRWNFSDWFINGPATTRFSPKTHFHLRRVRVHGASGTKLPFRCNSLRRSTPAGPKGRKAPSGPFSPLGQPARFARRLDKGF